MDPLRVRRKGHSTPATASGHGIRPRQMPRPTMDKGLSEETRTRDAENGSETRLA